MLLINLNTSTLETFLQEHPDAIFSVSPFFLNYILKIADVNDLERFDDGEYYSLVLHEICHIKRFELFKGI